MAALTQTIDAIREYQSIIDKYPMLSEEDELELAKRYKLQNDLKAAETLVLSHIRLVIKIAYDFQGYGQYFNDLIQVGTVGLMKAVKKFDYTKGIRLASYAILYIKGAIRDFVQENHKIVKIATTKALRKLMFNEGVITKHAFNPDKIAEELNISRKDVVTYRNHRNNDVHLGMIKEGRDNEVFMSDLPDFSYEPTNVLERNEHEWLLTEGIQNALKQLDERTRNIIQSRWLDEEPKTMKDLSEIYGVSIARVGQIEQAGLKKLREILK